MIKATELRIGNKFMSPFGKIETVLSVIDNTDRGKIKVLSKEELESGKIGYVSQEHMEQYSHLILCEENENQYKPIEISGIPLTQERVVGFGFKDGGQSSLIYSVFKISKSAVGGYDVHVGNGFTTITKQDTRIHLRYVHEFQNLYFDISKTQLNTNNLI